MKYPTLLKAPFFIVIFLFTTGMNNASAVSSSNSSKVSDYKLKASNGKSLKPSDISLAIRKIYRGVRPRISKRRLPGKYNCYDVKFIYKNELKRVSFNCTSNSLVMHAKK